VLGQRGGREAGLAELQVELGWIASDTSLPTTSRSSKGPIGRAQPSFMAVSISSAVA